MAHTRSCSGEKHSWVQERFTLLEVIQELFTLLEAIQERFTLLETIQERFTLLEVIQEGFTLLEAITLIVLHKNYFLHSLNRASLYIYVRNTNKMHTSYLIYLFQ